MARSAVQFSEEIFFTYVRRAPFGGRLLQKQVDGLRAIIAQPWSNDDHLAYALATVFHETAATMQPVRETLASSDAKAIAILDRAFKAGRLPTVKKPYWQRDADGKSWLGRGFVQLTHRRNYETLGAATGIDLVGSPGRAMEMDVSARILFIGMSRGLFTGKRLSDFFNDRACDAVGARRIINGSDKAQLIAGYFRAFRDAILTARRDTPPEDVSPRLAEPDDLPPAKSTSLMTAAAAVVASGGLGVVKDVSDSGAGLLSAVSNPWGFASLVFLVVALGIVGWLVASGRLKVFRGR